MASGPETKRRVRATSPRRLADAVTTLLPSPVPQVLAEELAAVIEPTVEAMDEAATHDVNETGVTAVDAAPALEEATETMASSAETMADAGADRARVMFGEMNERAKSAMEKGNKVVENLVEFAKGNVEAVVASGRAAAKGTETLVQSASDYGRKSFESASSAARSYASVKSPTELFQLQSEFARSAFDGLIAEASRFSETYVKVMSDVIEPLSTRFSVASEKFKTSAY